MKRLSSTKFCGPMAQQAEFHGKKIIELLIFGDSASAFVKKA